MKAKNKKRIKILGKVFFILYIVFIFYFLLLSDWYGRGQEMKMYHYNFVLFKEIKRFWNYREQLGIMAVMSNLLGNVLIFVPFGFFMPIGSRFRSFLATAFYGFGISLCVELFQLVIKVGSFDVDDLLLNTVGSILGYMLFILCDGIRRKFSAKR